MDNLNLISNFAEFKELKNIDKSTMIGVLEDVFRHLLIKTYETDENFDVIINPEKGDLEIWRNRTVVADGEVDGFIFGFEESYGYLAGPYVRDKDAIIGSMLICEMAAYYRAKGSSIKEELERIYTEYGRYLNKVDSFEFPGLSGMDKMADIMQNLRVNPPKDFAGDKVVKVVDYKKPEETGLPAANVLIYTLESGATVVVRPSGTEPKIKTYFTTKGKDLAEAEAQKEKLAEACKPLLA